MKQRKFGKKVQNWRAPLKRNELKNSFRRHLFADPAAQEQAFICGASIKGVGRQFDEYWNPYDPWHDDYDHDHVNESDLLCFELRKFFRELVGPAGVLFQVEDGGPNEVVDDSEKAEPIEERLTTHVRLITSWPIDSVALKNHLADAAIAIKEVCKTAESIANLDSGYLLCIQLFQPFWIRRPEDFAFGGDYVLI